MHTWQPLATFFIARTDAEPPHAAALRPARPRLMGTAAQIISARHSGNSASLAPPVEHKTIDAIIVYRINQPLELLSARLGGPGLGMTYFAGAALHGCVDTSKVSRCGCKSYRDNHSVRLMPEEGSIWIPERVLTVSHAAWPCMPVLHMEVNPPVNGNRKHNLDKMELPKVEDIPDIQLSLRQIVCNADRLLPEMR